MHRERSCWPSTLPATSSAIPGKRAQIVGAAPAEEEQVDPLEIEWKRKDGTTLKVRLSGREVGSEGGKDGYEVIVEDVTKQRELENHLRQAGGQGFSDRSGELSLSGGHARHRNSTIQAHQGEKFALLLLDLDGLKQINDRYGHVTGSQAICRVADVLSLSCRNIDTAARFGGDEFALVLPETGSDSAGLVADRIRERLANDRGRPKLSVSVGIALYPVDGDTLDTLIGVADVALYAAKAKVHRAATSTLDGYAKLGALYRA